MTFYIQKLTLLTIFTKDDLVCLASDSILASFHSKLDMYWQIKIVTNNNTPFDLL